MSLLHQIFSIEEKGLKGVEENLNHADKRQAHAETEKSSYVRGECWPADLLQ